MELQIQTAIAMTDLIVCSIIRWTMIVMPALVFFATFVFVLNYSFSHIKNGGGVIERGNSRSYHRRSVHIVRCGNNRVGVIQKSRKGTTRVQCEDDS